MANYKIQFDRDGSPYISHAWGTRTAYNRSAPVKYIAKIGKGAQAKYFYTAEQLRAFQQGGRQKVQNTAQKVSKTIKDKTNDIKYDVGMKTGTQYKKYAKDYNNQAKKTAKKADEAEMRLQKYEKNAKETDSQGRKWWNTLDQANKHFDRYDEAERLNGKAAYQKKQADAWADAYKKTPLGKLESTSDKMKEDFRKKQHERQEKIADTKEQLKNKAKDLAGYDERERMNASKKNVEDARKKGIEAYKKDEKAYQDYLDVKSGTKKAESGKSLEDYKKAADKTYEDSHDAHKNYEDALKKEREATSDYNRTPLGKIDSAKEAINKTKDAIKSIPEKSKEERREKAQDEKFEKIQKEIHKVDKSVDKWRDNNERPNSTDEVYKHGKVINKQQMYDFYMNEIKNQQKDIKRRAELGLEPKESDINYINHLMEMAETYSNKKKN